MYLAIIIATILLFIVSASLFIASHSYKFSKEANKYTPAKYGYGFEEISIQTKNDKKLYGWWVPAENPNNKSLPTIILIHGWSRNVDRMMSYIKRLHPEGYNLLAFDSRCHGRSDDDKFSSMVKFTEDIRVAIDYAEEQPNVDKCRFGLLGLSMGGAASIYVASLDERVKAVTTVGAFSHPEKVMGIEFKKHKIPYYPFVWLIFRYMEFRIGAKFNDIAPMNNIAKSDAKFLLVHGTNDETVPLKQAEEMHAASDKENTELFIVERKGHADCNHHSEFWPKVLEFYRTAL
jgi:dipeptidyl aminopeptidase/acylaminoacyl peptidase